ncbi:DsrE/DsrF-like family protein [Planctomycetes bacterium Poly30]|uniref:DsrE/DsrF-like family protein n=1 Tax=Saltatorellus ferox TaxID=2528018 RepID=A0A518ETS9_9BACT|nr:DsrE/DsrF-like family protein [Planctomycetes bacterium Poly30]
MKTVLLLNQDRMGHGDEALGRRILKTFLQKAIALKGLDAVLMVNGGVKLTAAGSEVLGELTMLEENGVDMVPCGTCLEQFGVTPAVGKVGSMDEIIGAMNRADKVITL